MTSSAFLRIPETERTIVATSVFRLKQSPENGRTVPFTHTHVWVHVPLTVTPKGGFYVVISRILLGC